MNEQDVRNAYLAVLHRQPENDQVVKTWVGHTFSEFASAATNSVEWKTHNEIILHAFASVSMELNSLRIQQAAKPQSSVDRAPQLVSQLQTILDQYKAAA